MKPTFYDHIANLTFDENIIPLPKTKILDLYFYALNRYDKEKNLIGLFTEALMLYKVYSDFRLNYLIQIDEFIQKRIEEEDSRVLISSLYNYYCCGKKTFNFSRGISNFLHSTEMNSTYEMLKFSFSSMYFNFEEYPFVIENEYSSKPHHIIGIFAHQQKNKPCFLILCSGDEGGVDYHLSYRLLQKEIEKHNKICLNDFDEDFGKTNMALELAIKAILYLNSENPETKINTEYSDTVKKIKTAKEKKKVDRLNKHLMQISQTDYFDVGRSIKINKEFVEKNREKIKTASGWTYNYRFWVRGHFRRQACGAGLKDRKLVWVQPHMKGPDQAAIVHKQYDVITKEQS